MTTFRNIAPLGFVAIMQVVSVQAATVRSNTLLHGPMVKLSDLFDDLTPGQDCEIGPSPSAGRKLVVPAAQIAAIASQYGIDLKTVGFARPVYLERPARIIKQQELQEALKAALLAAGAGSDSSITLGVYTAPALPADDISAPTVAGLEYDGQSGRFTASLQFQGSGEGSAQMRVTGRVDAMVDALLLTHTIAAGMQIGSDDVKPGRVRKANDHLGNVKDLSQLVGAVARQTLLEGTALRQDQISRTSLVNRNRPIVIKLTGGGLALTATGIALEDGGNGDRVHVMNSTTRAVLIGTVSASAEVMVDPGTAPVVVAQAGNNSPSLHLPSIPSFNAVEQTNSPVRLQ